jgi:hypothetical protein
MKMSNSPSLEDLTDEEAFQEEVDNLEDEWYKDSDDDDSD